MHFNLLFKFKPDSMMRIVLSVIFFVVISNVSYSQITKNLTLLNSKEIIEKGIAKFDAENYEEAEAFFKKVPIGDTLIIPLNMSLHMCIHVKNVMKKLWNYLKKCWKTKAAK